MLPSPTHLVVVSFAFLPVLNALLVQGVVFPPDLVILSRAFLVACGLSILLNLLVGRVTGSQPAATAAIAITIIGIALYPRVRLLVWVFWGVDYRLLFASVYSVGCVLLAFRVLFAKPQTLVHLNWTLRILAPVIVVVTLGVVWKHYGRTNASAPESKTEAALFSGIPSAVGSESNPDVYHVILDGFGRPDVLQKLYDVDLSPFVQALTDDGFDVAAENGIANYAQTYLSLASMLNASYVQELGTQTYDEPSRGPLHELIQRSSVLETFKRIGYQIHFIGSIYSATQQHRLADICECDYPLVGEFESTIFHLTPLAETGLGGLDYRPHRNKIRRTFSALQELEPTDRPRVLLAHIMAPHPPFVLDAQGNEVAAKGAFDFYDGTAFRHSKEDYIRGYRNQVVYVADQTLKVVRHFLDLSRRSQRSSVIIVHGDHGPRQRFYVRDPSKTDAGESLPVLLAIRWSPSAKLSPPVTSLVNVYRAFFSRYFGAPIDLLPNRAFMSSFSRPYEFIELNPEHLSEASDPSH